MEGFNVSNHQDLFSVFMEEQLYQLLEVLFLHWPDGLCSFRLTPFCRLHFTSKEIAGGDERSVRGSEAHEGAALSIPLVDFFRELSFEQKVDFMAAFYSYVGRRVSSAG
jgi:hypothetical protein